MILANALKIDLILIEENIDDLFTFETAQSNCQDCKRTPLFLHKRPDHYNAVVPLSIEPLWQHGHAHVNDALNSDNVDDRPNFLLPISSPLDGSSSLDGEKFNSSPSDDLSSLDDGQSDDVPDFLYRLKMHRKAHPTNLLSGSLNISSIRNKFSTVQNILQNAYVDIFGICETKLDDTFPEGQFYVNFFIYYRKDRSSNGGGLMMYVRSDIPQRRRHDLEKVIDCRESGLEIMIIETTMNNKELWIYVVGYKPPNVKSSVFIDAFSLMRDLILKESNNVVILGDYNCDFMSVNALKDLCIFYDIHNLVSSPLVTKVIWAHWSMFALCRNPFVSRQHSILIVGWVTSITSFVSPQNCLFLNDHQELFSIGHTKILLTNCLSAICLYYLIQWCIVITISICVLISLSSI